MISINRAIEGPTCGLLPVGSKVNSVTTEGLMWDVRDVPMEFGGLVSSSNSFEEPANFAHPLHTVTVSVSEPLIFTVEHRFVL